MANVFEPQITSGSGRCVVVRTSIGKAAVVVFPAIALIVGALFAFSYLASSALGLPPSLNFPWVVRGAGLALVIAGLALAGWVFAYRSPAAMALSTYFTFVKLFRRLPLAEPSGRKEPLIIAGPQKYVRSPLYLGVIVMTFGWGLFGSCTFVLVAAALLLLWFRAVLIPFEERELRALFGEQYREYAERVPMLFPFTKRKR